ncbi:WxL protein peptidoglycan domain-containing protein [Embleya sp. MST-111070]|uniref:WxL protein peptidoglycan domain-containing protein n=1 Tax=Embleya sp. MST-111070 TaxID=3398231 RepID=UPI003F736700
MTGTPAPPIRRQGGRTRTLATLFAVLATLFASLTLVASAPASAAGNGEWSVDPYVPDGTSQNARRYFFLEGAAGTTVPDVVTLHNTSQAPLTLKLFGADAYNTARDGGFALRTVTDKQKDVGTWIQVAPENQTLTLQPGEKRQVPFNIVIPPNATPGDHPGAVVALNTAIEGTQQQGQIKVNIQRQIGARVYLRVQGDALPAMDVQKVEVKRDSGFHEFFGSSKATITYRIVNRGNVILRPKFDLKVEGLFGRKLMGKTEEGIEILPGSTVEKVVEWKDAPRLDHVTVKVGAVAPDQKLDDSASTSYTAAPWPSLLTLAAILILAGLGWGLWRNGRKGKGGDPAEPNGPAGPNDDTTVLPPIPAAPMASAAPGVAGASEPVELAKAGASDAAEGAAGEGAANEAVAGATGASAVEAAQADGAVAAAADKRDEDGSGDESKAVAAESASVESESAEAGSDPAVDAKAAEGTPADGEAAAADSSDDAPIAAEAATPVAKQPAQEADNEAEPDGGTTAARETEVAAGAEPAGSEAAPETGAEPAKQPAASGSATAAASVPVGDRADASVAEGSADSAGVGR